MEFTAAASLPEAEFTVWANLFDPRRIHAGDRFLMQGGTSGIGTFAIQAAKAFGASLAATAGSPKKCEFLLALGCERAFCYREEDWETKVMEWSGGNGVDVVLDMVGGDYFAKHVRVLAKDGHLVHCHYCRQQGGTGSAGIDGEKANPHGSVLWRRKRTCVMALKRFCGLDAERRDTADSRFRISTARHCKGS